MKILVLLSLLAPAVWGQDCISFYRGQKCNQPYCLVDHRIYDTAISFVDVDSVPLINLAVPHQAGQLSTLEFRGWHWVAPDTNVIESEDEIKALIQNKGVNSTVTESPFTFWNGLYLSFEVDRSWDSPKDTDVQLRLAPSFNLTKNLTADFSVSAGSRVYYSFSVTRKIF